MTERGKDERPIDASPPCKSPRRLRKTVSVAARAVRWLVLLLVALSVCTMLALSAYAAQRGWQLRVGAFSALAIFPLVGGSLFVATWFTWWARTTDRLASVLGEFAKGGAILIVWIATLLLELYLFLLLGFSDIEHEVEFEGERAVAEVDAFLDVNVSYYEYQGPLFKGALIGSEWYGSGGYDPFELDTLPEPRRRERRDANGEWTVEQFGERAPAPPEAAPSVEAPRSEEEQAAEALAETEAAFEETGSAYRVTGTVTSQIGDGGFSFRVDDGQGVLQDGATYQVRERADVRRLFGMKGLQWGMDGVVVGFSELPTDNVLLAGVIVGNDDTSSAYWESR